MYTKTETIALYATFALGLLVVILNVANFI